MEMLGRAVLFVALAITLSTAVAGPPGRATPADPFPRALDDGPRMPSADRAESIDASAQLALGVAHLLGRGPPRDEAKAEEWAMTAPRERSANAPEDERLRFIDIPYPRAKGWRGKAAEIQQRVSRGIETGAVLADAIRERNARRQ